MLSYQAEIRRIVEGRNIPSLFHFTQRANLKGIFLHGLLNRTILAAPEYAAYASAEHRLDDTNEAISVSISDFNSVLFASSAGIVRSVSTCSHGHSPWGVVDQPERPF